MPNAKLGAEWIATPFLVRSFTLYFMLVYSCAQGSALLLLKVPIVQAVLDNPIVQRSRSFVCARTVTRLCCSRACLRMAHRGGRWMLAGNACRRLEHLDASSTAFVLINIFSVNQ